MQTKQTSQLISLLSILAGALLLLFFLTPTLAATPARAPSLALADVTIYPASDTTIDAAHSRTNYGTTSDLLVGRVAAKDRRILVRFDLSAIPAGSTITSAYLDLQRVFNQVSAASITARNYYVWPDIVLSSWGEKTVTWDNQPATKYLSDPASDTNAGGASTRWNVTNIVRNWVEDGHVNYGILLRGDGDTEDSYAYYSRQTNFKPSLVVTYTEPTTTPTATRSASHTPTYTPTRTPRATQTPTVTPTPRFTATPTRRPTHTPIATPTTAPTSTPRPTTTPTATNVPTTTYTTTVAALAGGTESLIRVIANDGVRTASDTSDAPFKVPQQPPLVTISTADGVTFPVDQPVVLQGDAVDNEDGHMTSGALRWTVFGLANNKRGDTLTLFNVPAGSYEATLTATDSDGMAAMATIHFTVGSILYLPVIAR
ncbi:MAG: DNRLRE domain-containing protein [Chloroflexi bacterium]|nr:DNRLRE domain-containing protein [Chloroflexota bacterium]